MSAKEIYYSVYSDQPPNDIKKAIEQRGVTPPKYFFEILANLSNQENERSKGLSYSIDRSGDESVADCMS